MTSFDMCLIIIFVIIEERDTARGKIFVALILKNLTRGLWLARFLTMHTKRRTSFDSEILSFVQISRVRQELVKQFFENLLFAIREQLDQKHEFRVEHHRC